MSYKLRYTVQGFCRSISSLWSLVAVGLLLVIAANGTADEKVDRAELPKLVDMPIPTAEELFAADENDKEFDWDRTAGLCTGRPHSHRCKSDLPSPRHLESDGRGIQETRNEQTSEPEGT